MGVWPFLVYTNGVEEPIERSIVLLQFLISASKVENTRLVILVQLECLLIAVECELVLLHLVQNHALVVPVVRIQVNVLD